MNPPLYQHLAGTIRANLPAETLAWLKPFYPKLGITRIADISNLDILDLPVIAAVRPFSKNLSIALGKGISTELAEISAVMESIEGYHAEHLAPATHHGSFTDLQAQGLPVVDPEPFVKGVLQHTAPHGLELGWIQAENLNPESPALCYFPHTLCNLDLSAARPEAYYFQVSSNGLAAGNTYAEATVHALLELIERDAFFVFGQRSDEERLTLRLDLNSIQNDAFQHLWTKMQTKNMELKVWDITHHMGVPAYHACLYDESFLSPIYFSSGAGSHLSKEVALLRAVTEAVQGRTALISGTRDDIYPNYYLFQQKLRQESVPDEAPPPTRQWADCTEPVYAASFEENVQDLVARIGNDVYRVDLRQPEFNIPVVFAHAPNLSFTGARM